MRTSVFSRSVIAVASLAIGSVALAAAPASATPPPVITRDLVLAIAQAPSESEISDDERLLVELACDFEANTDDVEGSDHFHSVYSTPFVTDNADGVLVTAHLHEQSAGDDTVDRWCTFAALVTTDEAFTLTGNALITLTGGEELRRASDPVVATTTSALSGNLFVTEPVNVDNSFGVTSASLTAAGNATRSIQVPTTEQVTYAKTRTAAGEKAAKAKYDKRLKAAKKWYAKALKKAGDSKKKKAAVKKAYAAKKAAYKRAYEKVYYGVKTVTKTTTQTEKRPFNVTVDHEMNLPE